MTRILEISCVLVFAKAVKTPYKTIIALYTEQKSTRGEG